MTSRLAPVGIVRDHLYLLGQPRARHQDFAGKDFDFLDLRGRRIAIKRALGNPLEQGLIVAGIQIKAHPAAMGNLHGRLGESQAAWRIYSIDPPTGDVMHQHLVIKMRIVSA